MKLIQYKAADGSARVGIVEGNTVFEGGTSVLSATKGKEVGPLAGLHLLSPVTGPRKIVCIGLNYHDHAAEAGQPIPENPIIFAKFENALVGHGEAIVLPSFSKEVDYEAELGVVMAKRASRVSVDEALDYVLGYTCINDVSAREIQFGDGQWIRGKTPDTFCPTGPWIVTADDIPDPQTLGIRCILNGETLQNSSTKEMARSVAELIAFITQGITLEPGDLIATGTPAGVGFTRKPPIYLKDGDVVAVEIDGIGTLENPVVASS